MVSCKKAEPDFKQKSGSAILSNRIFKIFTNYLQELLIFELLDFVTRIQL